MKTRPLGVPLHHDLCKGPVDQIHFCSGTRHRSPFEPYAADNDRLVLQSGRHIEIHGDVGKRSLETDPRRDVDVEDEFLQSLFDSR